MAVNHFSSSSNSDFYLGNFTGFLIGCVFSFVTITAMVDQYEMIEWETLVAGSLAAFGAVGTIFIINKQIWAGEHARRLKQTRLDKIARAQANINLSILTDRTIRAANALYEGSSPVTIDADGMEPFHILAGSENTEVAQWSLFLISRIQVFNSRIRNAGNLGRNRAVYAVDACEILAAMNCFWGYVRGDTDKIIRVSTLQMGGIRFSPTHWQQTDIEFFNDHLAARNETFDQRFI